MGGLYQVNDGCRAPQCKQDTVRVTYSTRDGQAIGGKQEIMDVDYESTSGELVFQPGENIKDIFVNIFQDFTESNEEFYVDLLPVDGCDVQLLRSTVRICYLCHMLRNLKISAWQRHAMRAGGWS